MIKELWRELVKQQYNVLFSKTKLKEEYYNNKYPKQNISYSRTDKETIKIDVRQFLNYNNFMLPKLIGTDDQKALRSLKWIISNIKYTPDKTQYNLREYWAFPHETFNVRKGDCEDGAILLYSIMRKNNIPAWKIRISAGFVINSKKERSGHAYVTYYCEESGEWVILDWCYYPNTRKIKDRESYLEEKMYEETWFSFNESFSWGKDGDIRKKAVKDILS